MIKAIEGVISKKDPAYIWLKTTSGVSYGIAVSLQCSPKLTLGAKCELLISQIIKEDANLLFGFIDASEQQIFEMMLKVSGIGPATAMAICSTLSPAQAQKAVLNGDLDAFKKVPGIGPKTAKLLLAQLSDASFINSQNENPVWHDALLALQALGFKKEQILPALNACKSENTVDLIKEALRILKK